MAATAADRAARGTSVDGSEKPRAFHKQSDGAAAHGAAGDLDVDPGIDPAVLLHESDHVLEQRYRTVHADVLENWANQIPEMA